MNVRLWILFEALMLVGCIGVDYLEDPVIGERIEVSTLQAALMPTQNLQLTAVYFDKYGNETEDMLQWASNAPQIASVDENGVVTAIATGQAVITAFFQTVLSEPININVVSDENAVASVVISSPVTMVEIGEKVSLTAVVNNINGLPLAGRTIEWFSENSAIVTVDATGELTAVSNGIAGVHAKSEGVKSNSIDFAIGSDRAGTFVPAGGYNAEGMATLKLEEGKLMLTLSDNFKTSFALGTYIYLSNSTSGSETFSKGVEIAQIFNSGAKTFNISSINPNVGLFDFRYVIILCKPARLTFGFADLN